MADNTLLSASTGTGDIIRTVHKSTYKTPVSLIDVGGTSTGVESIIGDSTHYMPVSIRAIAAGVTLPVSLTTASTVHIAPLTTNSTIHAVVSGSTISVSPLTTASTIHAIVSGSTISISPLTTASTIHATVSGSTVSISPLTTASTIHAVVSGSTVSVSGSTVSVSGSTVSVSPLTTASTIHAIVSGSTVSVSGSTVSISPLTTASTVHVAPLTTASTIHVAPLTTASTIHVAPLTTATTINVVITGGGGTGGTAVEDDSAFTPSSGLGTPMFGLVSVTTVTTGNVGAIRMLDNRQVAVTLFDSAGAELAVGGGTQYTIGTSGSTGNTGTVALGYRKDTAATLVDTTGKLTAPIFDGSGRMWTNASGSTINVAVVSISGTTSQAVTVTTASSINIAPLTTASTIHAVVSGSTVSISPLTTASTIHIAPLTTASTVHIVPLTTASTVHVAPLTTASTIHANASGSTLCAQLVAVTSGGCSVFNKVGSTVFETTTIKLTGGSVYGISGYNNTLNPIFVKLYNTTAAPTTSNTAAMRFIIPATTVTGAAGFVEDYGACPVSFTTGIGIRITGGSILDAATEAAASTASQYTVNVRYS